LFDFLNQTKSCECCIYVDASWCLLSAKGFKNAFRCCPNPSKIFPDFFGICSHFCRAVSIYWKALKSFSGAPNILFGLFISNLSLGIFLEFLEFSGYFRAFKHFLGFPKFVLH
jgi:hypothetical protein